MARARKHGTWSKVHESIDEHPKTQAAAAVLVEELGLEDDHARAVVTRAVRRLVCWAIRESDSGRTAHLEDGQVASIGWPASMRPGGSLWGREDVGALRRALRAIPVEHDQGYLTDAPRGRGRKRVEVIHEFHAYAWAVLKDRPHYKGTTLEEHLGANQGANLASTEVEPTSTSDPNPKPSTAPNPLPFLGPLRAEPARPSTPIGIGRGREIDRSGGEGPKATSEVMAPMGSKAVIEDLVRRLRPSRHGGLNEAGVYVQRLSDSLDRDLGEIPAAYGLAQLSTPGRALEELEPEAFELLVEALLEKGENVKAPTAYATKALAKRWQDTITQRTEEALRRRESARASRRSG